MVTLSWPNLQISILRKDGGKKMSKYESLAKEILENIGGKENINSLTHCITRLRFNLKDESIANDEALKNNDGVVTVMKSGGQYQVVIGNHVPYVYEDVCKLAGISMNTNQNETTEAPKGVFNKLIDIISGCFQPILGAMCAAGMIKGLNALFAFLGLYGANDGTYIVLNAIGDSVFYFMPVLIGYTSAKKFGLNPMVGMVMGAAVCYPTIQLDTLSSGDVIGQFLGSNYNKTFLGLPFLAANYTNSVVPIILMSALGAKLEKLAKKFIPEVIQTFFVPLFILIIGLPIGLLIIGPVITILTDLLSTGFANLYAFSPILSGAVIGFFWQVLVIFGLHWAIVPLAMINIGSLGYDTILIGQFGCSFAQTAAVGAMYFKLKDKKLKNLCFPAVISGICGVTEPAIYGLSLPKKIPFFCSMAGGAAGGAVFAALEGKMYMMGGLGIFGVTTFIDPATNDASGLVGSFICIAVSAVVGFVLTMLLFKDKDNNTDVIEEKMILENGTIMAPIEGTVMPIEQSSDAAFASGALGKGVVIVPQIGKVYAPLTGTITVLFPSLHAIGITGDNGVEILIHVGINTVQLNGEGFTAHIKQGDHIDQGQLLLEFDMDKIKDAGYSLETPVLVTNHSDLKQISNTSKTEISINDELFKVQF